MTSVMADSAHPTPAGLEYDEPGQRADRPIRQDAPAHRPAFAQVAAEHQPRVARLAQRLLGWGSAADVDDVVQEVFVSAWRHLARFRGDASLATWLTRLTINQCRRQRRRRLVGLNLLRQWSDRATKVNPPADPVAQDERLSRVRDAVRKLPARYREAIVLRYLEGMDIADVVTVLGLSRSAVEVRLHRARTMLKEPLVDLIEE